MPTIELRSDDIVYLRRLLEQGSQERYGRIWGLVKQASTAEDEANTTEAQFGGLTITCKADTEHMSFSLSWDDYDRDEHLDFEESDFDSLEACLREARARLADHRAKFPPLKGE